jgi:hypothetical protein
MGYQDTRSDDKLNPSMFWSAHFTNMMERNCNGQPWLERRKNKSGQEIIR